MSTTFPLQLPHAEFEAVRAGAKKFVLHKGPTSPRAGDVLDLSDADTAENLKAAITYVTSSENHCALSPDGLKPQHAICSITV